MQIAVIHEPDCIGCNRCVTACPIDSIVGSFGYMHSIILEECIGCGLCLAPCPVDCITLTPDTTLVSKGDKAVNAKTRFKQRQRRVLQASLRQLPTFNSSEVQAQIQEDLVRCATSNNSEFKIFGAES